MLAKQDTGRTAYTLWSISQAQHRSQHVNLCSSLSRHAKDPLSVTEFHFIASFANATEFVKLTNF